MSDTAENDAAYVTLVETTIAAHQRSVVRLVGPCICGRWPSLGTTYPQHVADEYRRALSRVTPPGESP